MPREVGGACRGRGRPQRLDAGPVQLEALGGQQVVGDGLGEQGVTELVAALAPRLEHVVLDGGAQRGPQRHGVDAGHPLEQRRAAPAGR